MYNVFYISFKSFIREGCVYIFFSIALVLLLIAFVTGNNVSGLHIILPTVLLILIPISIIPIYMLYKYYLYDKDKIIEIDEHEKTIRYFDGKSYETFSFDDIFLLKKYQSYNWQMPMSYYMIIRNKGNTILVTSLLVGNCLSAKLKNVKFKQNPSDSSFLPLPSIHKNINLK